MTVKLLLWIVVVYLIVATCVFAWNKRNQDPFYCDAPTNPTCDRLARLFAAPLYFILSVCSRL